MTEGLGRPEDEGRHEAERVPGAGDGAGQDGAGQDGAGQNGVEPDGGAAPHERPATGPEPDTPAAGEPGTTGATAGSGAGAAGSRDASRDVSRDASRDGSRDAAQDASRAADSASAGDPFADFPFAGKLSAGGPFAGSGSAGDPSTGDPSADGSAGDPRPSEADELAIRRLLQDSVRDIEPAPDALDHLRRAVPARRTHRRAALVGAVAAALVAVVGVPTLLYGGVVPGVGDDKHPLTASSSHGQSHGPEGSSGATDGDPGGKGGKDGKDKESGKDEKGEGSADPEPSGGPGGGSASPDDTLSASAPSCGRDQLGRGTAQTGSPDGQGRVYGSFRVTNTSGDACTVDGEGMVGASVQGGSERARVAIMDHTPGDPAPGLGDPAAASDALVLRPGASYMVKFAWVPNSGGSGCSSNSPSPNGARADDSPSPGVGGDGGGGTGEEQPGDDSGGGSGGTTTPGDGSGGNGDSGGSGGGDSAVVLSHTPEVGSPAIADTKLDGGCGGTVYRTGVLPAS